MPVAVAVVALTAGLALLTFVKAYGIAFLARPRSDGAAAAHESGAWTMRPAMLLSAAAVLALGLRPGSGRGGRHPGRRYWWRWPRSAGRGL